MLDHVQTVKELEKISVNIGFRTEHEYCRHNKTEKHDT